MPSGPPSKQRPSPLQRRVTCLIRGLGAAAANAAVGSEELIVLRLKFLGSLSSVELDKGRAGVHDVLISNLTVWRIGEKRAQVLRRFFAVAGAQEQEREAVVRTGCGHILAENVPVGLGRFLGHPDPRIHDRDLLQDDGVSRMLLQREPQRRQRLVELALAQKGPGLRRSSPRGPIAQSRKAYSTRPFRRVPRGMMTEECPGRT